jgi:hypothetical protein
MSTPHRRYAIRVARRRVVPRLLVVWSRRADGADRMLTGYGTVARSPRVTTSVDAGAARCRSPRRARNRHRGPLHELFATTTRIILAALAAGSRENAERWA